MPTFTNPGPDGWDIPLYGITVAPGETVTVGEDDPGDSTRATIDETPTPEAEQQA